MSDFVRVRLVAHAANCRAALDRGEVRPALPGDLCSLRGANLRVANLRGADLRGADLSAADLSRADLGEADLSRADLSRADLGEADLSRADLSRADLSGASLRWADLSEADLGEADLSRADLRGADLSGASLSRADLRGADLSGASLRWADLRGADLRGADLNVADLNVADLSVADLSPIRDDVAALCASAPAEVSALLAALRGGRVDGSVYQGECACLVGTIANARGCLYTELEGLRPDGSRPAERWALAIRRGDTPETSQVSALTVAWIEAWLVEQQGKAAAEAQP